MVRHPGSPSHSPRPSPPIYSTAHVRPTRTFFFFFFYREREREREVTREAAEGESKPKRRGVVVKQLSQWACAPETVLAREEENNTHTSKKSPRGGRCFGPKGELEAMHGHPRTQSMKAPSLERHTHSQPRHGGGGGGGGGGSPLPLALFFTPPPPPYPSIHRPLSTSNTCWGEERGGGGGGPGFHLEDKYTPPLSPPPPHHRSRAGLPSATPPRRGRRDKGRRGGRSVNLARAGPRRQQRGRPQLLVCERGTRATAFSTHAILK